MKKIANFTPSLYPLLPYVALGTICDLAKLTPVNLKLVRHGLKAWPTSPYWGLKIFLSHDERKLPTVEGEKLSFQIGPMINSKGRLDHPERALKLLISDDPTEAFDQLSHLEVCNKQRKDLQAQVFKEAKKQIIGHIDYQEAPIHIVYEPHWHEGVIGIVASKIVETFNAPAIVFTDSEEEGVIKASCRSCGEMNLFACLDECRDLFMRFGGHKAAAGLSMKKDLLPTFKEAITNIVQQVPFILRSKPEWFDIELNINDIDVTFAKQLEMLGPWGMGNPKPLLKVYQVKIEQFKILKDVHVSWELTAFEAPGMRIKGMSFNYMNNEEALKPEELLRWQKNHKRPLTLIGICGINRFRGNEFIQLQIQKFVQDLGMPF
jgi:single-stranded-DNA-specific exonuclease